LENFSIIVSVAVITYNQKAFLEECLNSILEQSFKNYEIVISDDGSSDGTPEMLVELEKKFPKKVKLVLNNKNEGITKNCNKVLKICSGKYIAWMGGDDLMLPGKLEKQVAFMEANPDCSICYHNLDVFDSETNRTIKTFNDSTNSFQGDVRQIIRHGTFNGACSTMVRRDCVPKCGFNELLPVASDWLFWVECTLRGGLILYIDEILGRYRRHTGNVTIQKATIGQNEIDHLNSCNFILSYAPNFFEEVMYRYSQRLLSLRFRLPYFKCVWRCFLISPTIKELCRLVCYLVTFGYIKL